MSWINGGNHTIYVNQHQYDEIINASMNISGYVTNGSYPTGLKIYINNTLSNDLGLIYNENIILDTLNDSSTSKNLTFSKSETKIERLKIPKNAQVSSAYINLSGFYSSIYESNNTEQNYSCTGDLTWDWKRNYPTSGFYPCSQAVDENWETQASTLSEQSIYENYSIPRNTSNVTWKFKHSRYYNSDGPISFYYFNYTSNDYQVLLYCYPYSSCWGGNQKGPVTVIYDIPPDGVNNSIISTKVTLLNVNYYEGMINYTRIVNPINPYLEVGILDGVTEWNYTGNFTVLNNKTSNFNSSIMDYLDACSADSEGYCNVPLYLVNSPGGTIQISDIQINYTSDPNPIILDVNLIKSFLGNSTNSAKIPIRFESTKNGTITIDNFRLDYAGGNDTIEIKVHNVTYESNETINVTAWYSDWDFEFPSFVNYLEFIPKLFNSKNVTPYGQTNSTSIFNFTTYNYVGKNMNLSIYLNGTSPCINMTWNTNSTRPPNTWPYLLNSTWRDINTNLTYLNNTNIWLWEDLNCSYKNWTLWYPQIFLRACCKGCICSEDLI